MKYPKVLMVIALILAAAMADAQSIKGVIYDKETGEPLPGVNILYTDQNGKSQGLVSDFDGSYSIKVPATGVDFLYASLGYENQVLHMVFAPNEVKIQDIYMEMQSTLLGEVVVSASRFEQKITDVTVSMDLLKEAQITRQSPSDLSSTLNTLPGVDINDKQPSIRGGNGWTYGVGSRCLMLVDGMNVLDPVNGMVNWNTLPVENIAQVEVMKGASSVLYGSSALNGIINVRSKRPELDPKTTIRTYFGIYDNPAQSSYRWSDPTFWKEDKYSVQTLARQSVLSGVRNPIYEGADLSHSRRIGNFDVSVSMNMMTDEGYRQQGFNKRFRVGGNMTYHHPMSLATRNMNYGFNADYLADQAADFFLWRSPAEVYRPSSFANMGREGNHFNLNPFFNYTDDENGTSHKIKARFYYKDDSLIQASEQTDIATILGNMGTDFGKIKGTIEDIKGGDYSFFVPILVPIVKGDLAGLVQNTTGILQGFFPTATTADYSDLIAWVMSHGFPSGENDIIPWLSGVISPRQNPVHIDRMCNYYLDYQFHKNWKNGANLTSGLTYEHNRQVSEVTGTHNTDNISLFLQYDQRFFDRLSVSAGMRMEYYRVDNFMKEAQTDIFGVSIPFRPIFRAGLNYQLGTFSFLRASFGQGYRYPSLTEKYARKDIGGVGVYPNPELKAESGFNAEIGFKQGYRFGNVTGSVDIAGFYTQYSDMIEFRFGFFNNDTFEYINSIPDVVSMISRNQTPGLGAQFYNVSKARIYGTEISTTGIWKFNNHSSLTYNLGYVFIEPEDVGYKEKNALEDTYKDPLQMKEKSNRSKYLKYRQRHTGKAVLDFNWQRLNIGLNLIVKSKTLAVDYIMVDEREKEKPEIMDYFRTFLFGKSGDVTLASYWKEHNRPYCTLDLRAGVDISEKISTQFTVTNLLNTEYSTRPMAVAPPRAYLVQLNFKF